MKKIAIFCIFAGLTFSLIKIGCKPKLAKFSQTINCVWENFTLPLEIEYSIKRQKGHAHGVMPVTGENEFKSQIKVNKNLQLNTINLELVAVSNGNSYCYFFFRTFFGTQDSWRILEFDKKDNFKVLNIDEIDWSLIHTNTHFFNKKDKYRLKTLSLLFQLINNDANFKLNKKTLVENYTVLLEELGNAPSMIDGELYSFFWALTSLDSIKEILNIINSLTENSDINNFGPNAGTAYFMINLIHNRDWLKRQDYLLSKYKEEYEEFKETSKDYKSEEFNKIMKNLTKPISLEIEDYKGAKVFHLILLK